MDVFEAPLMDWYINSVWLFSLVRDFAVGRQLLIVSSKLKEIFYRLVYYFLLC